MALLMVLSSLCVSTVVMNNLCQLPAAHRWVCLLLQLLRISDELNIAADAFVLNQAPVHPNADYIMDTILTWFQIVAVSVPVVLICLSDTGLLFSLMGGLLSGIIGFYRGIGSYK